MSKLKRICAIVLSMAMMFCVVSTTAFATTPIGNITADDVVILNDAFEEKVRRAGRIIAEERGLLVDTNTFEQYKSSYATQAMNNTDMATFYEEIKSNSVTLDEIYQRFPELATEAVNTTGLDKAYIEPMTTRNSTASPEFGD